MKNSFLMLIVDFDVEFFDLMFNILKNHMNFIMVYQFLAERMKTEKLKKLVYMIKLNLYP